MFFVLKFSSLIWSINIGHQRWHSVKLSGTSINSKCQQTLSGRISTVSSNPSSSPEAKTPFFQNVKTICLIFNHEASLYSLTFQISSGKGGPCDMKDNSIASSPNSRGTVDRVACFFFNILIWIKNCPMRSDNVFSRPFICKQLSIQNSILFYNLYIVWTSLLYIWTIRTAVIILQLTTDRLIIFCKERFFFHLFCRNHSI